MQTEQTEEKEVRQQTRMEVMKRMVRRMRAKGRMDAHNRWWVSELLAVEYEKRGSTQNGKYDEAVVWLRKEKKKDGRKRMKKTKNTGGLLDEVF